MIWPNVNLGLPTPRHHQGDPADQTNPAQDRREIDPVFFLMSDLNRTQLRIFFLGIPPQSTIGKAHDADDDQDDANNARRLHLVRVCGVR
jgi:hypothetical protein